VGELKPKGLQQPGRKPKPAAIRKLDDLEAAITALLERTQEIRALLNAESTPALHAKDLLTFFAQQWQARYGTAYVPSYAKEIAALKRLVVALGPDEVAARIDRYLATDSGIYVQAFHPVALFAASVNKFGSNLNQSTMAAPPIDCRHVPACIDDQTHTKRKLQESREAAR